MSRTTRSARGEAINFDLISIKQQLAATPAPVNVNARRNFIDERDGIKSRENTIYTPSLIETSEINTDDPLAIAASAAAISKKNSK